jgi:hypothetical protein
MIAPLLDRLGRLLTDAAPHVLDLVNQIEKDKKETEMAGNDDEEEEDEEVDRLPSSSATHARSPSSPSRLSPNLFDSDSESDESPADYDIETNESNNRTATHDSQRYPPTFTAGLVNVSRPANSHPNFGGISGSSGSSPSSLLASYLAATLLQQSAASTSGGGQGGVLSGSAPSTTTSALASLLSAANSNGTSPFGGSVDIHIHAIVSPLGGGANSGSGAGGNGRAESLSNALAAAFNLGGLSNRLNALNAHLANLNEDRDDEEEEDDGGWDEDDDNRDARLYEDVAIGVEERVEVLSEDDDDDDDDDEDELYLRSLENEIQNELAGEEEEEEEDDGSDDVVDACVLEDAEAEKEGELKKSGASAAKVSCFEVVEAPKVAVACSHSTDDLQAVKKSSCVAAKENDTVEATAKAKAAPSPTSRAEDFASSDEGSSSHSSSSSTTTTPSSSSSSSSSSSNDEVKKKSSSVSMLGKLFKKTLGRRSSAGAGGRSSSSSTSSSTST